MYCFKFSISDFDIYARIGLQLQILNKFFIPGWHSIVVVINSYWLKQYMTNLTKLVNAYYFCVIPNMI